MSVIEIKNERLSVGINTLGSELMYITSEDGTDYLWNRDEKVWSLSSPILFPICGGLKNDKYTYMGKEYHLDKHGFAQVMEFDGEKLSNTKAEFTLKYNSETLKQFPFEFEFKTLFELSGNKLKVTYITKNLSDKEMFFSVGAHEGYYCPEGIEEYSVSFDENQTLDSYILKGNLLENNKIRIIENSKSIPLKYEYFKVDALVFKNICFNKVYLVHKNSKKRIALTFDKAKYFLLWTKPDAKYICLEPWCGVQDIIDSDYEISKKEGIIKLRGNGIHTFTHTIEIFD